MKYLTFLTCFILSFFFLFLNEIIPQCHDTNCLGYYQENNSAAIITHYHNTDTKGNCIGYAIAETQQSYLGPICGQTKSISIDEAYAKNYWLTWGFYYKYNFNGSTGLQANDILIWDPQPNNVNYKLTHAAVVNYAGSGYISIRWIDATKPGNDIQNSSLSSSNNYSDPSYGTPSNIIRRNSSKKTYGYAITFKTSFNSGTLKVDGVSYNINGSGGAVVKNLSYGEHNLYADDRQYDGSAWVGYKEWLDFISGQQLASDPVRTATINLNISNGFGKIFTANYVPFYNVTVQNNFVGISYNGKVWINDVLYDAPKTLEVKEGAQIEITIPNHKENTIDYLFDHWQDGDTTNSKNFSNINGNLNLTAYYKGRPSRYDLDLGYNLSLHTSTTVGQPITLYWNEHPNPLVTKYQIWRKEKYQGVTSTPHLLSTKNRGVTSYVDHDFVYTTLKNQYMVYYDVRPYYSLEGTYSYELWLPVFAEELAKPLNSIATGINILENSLSNFPNPFNPTTTIHFSIKETGFVNIRVFDLIGQQVAELVNEEKQAGSYKAEFNAASLPSGVYIYKIQAGSFVTSKKMVLLK
jgi:hypothetical protein